MSGIIAIHCRSLIIKLCDNLQNLLVYVESFNLKYKTVATNAMNCEILRIYVQNVIENESVKMNQLKVILRNKFMNSFHVILFRVQ